MTPTLQLMPSLSPMELDDMVLKDADPEADSRGGAYQHQLIACWSEYIHFQAHKMIAEKYLDGLSINRVSGLQLGQGSTPQQFDHCLVGWFGHHKILNFKQL